MLNFAKQRCAAIMILVCSNFAFAQVTPLIALEGFAPLNPVRGDRLTLQLRVAYPCGSYADAAPRVEVAENQIVVTVVGLCDGGFQPPGGFSAQYTSQTPPLSAGAYTLKTVRRDLSGAVLSTRDYPPSVWNFVVRAESLAAEPVPATSALWSALLIVLVLWFSRSRVNRFRGTRVDS